MSSNRLQVTDTYAQDGATATGSGTVVDLNGFGPFMAQVTGTFTATVTFEGTLDGTNFIAIGGQPVATPFTVANVSTTAAAAGIWYFDLPALLQMRARVSAFTDGSVTVRVRSVAS